MKNTLLILILAFLIGACKDKAALQPDRGPSELLSLNSWKLERYTDQNRKAINNSSLNISAIALFGLVFEFRSDKETRAVDRLTKNILIEVPGLYFLLIKLWTLTLMALKVNLRL